jgi:hypothetical protein
MANGSEDPERHDISLPALVDMASRDRQPMVALSRRNQRDVRFGSAR